MAQGTRAGILTDTWKHFHSLSARNESPRVKCWGVDGIRAGACDHTSGGSGGSSMCRLPVSSDTITDSVRGQGKFGYVSYGASSGRDSTHTSKPMMHKNSS